MAIHSAIGIVNYVSLPARHKDLLGTIRYWKNVKLGLEEDTVWLKDLSPDQSTSVDLKILPYKTLYYSSGPYLFEQGSLLPARTIPSLVWTSIESGLPVDLPATNHNYFGLTETVAIRLHPSTGEKEAAGLLVPINVLRSYIESAPSVRFKSLDWVIVNGCQAFVAGSPVLPLNGEVYWREGDFFLPAGLDFEYPVLTNTLQAMLNPALKDWVVWTKEGTYFTITKDAVKPLTLYSFRKTVKACV